MISNNLRALLATSAKRSLLSARVRVLDANTLGHGLTHTTAICFLPQTRTQEPLSVGTVGFGNTLRFAKTNTYTEPRFTRGTNGITHASVSVRSSTFCLSRCGFQWQQPLDCTSLLNCCFALKPLNCVYTSSQPQIFY